jgi:hypothetical protein
MNLLLLGGAALAKDPRHFELLNVARQLHEEGKSEFAVVAAQTACEVYAEVAITELLKARRLGDRRAHPGATRRLQPHGQARPDALPRAHRPQHPARRFWKNYRRHVERRNAVVHKGKEPTDDEALASIGAAEAFFA